MNLVTIRRLEETLQITSMNVYSYKTLCEGVLLLAAESEEILAPGGPNHVTTAGTTILVQDPLKCYL